MKREDSKRKGTEAKKEGIQLKKSKQLYHTNPVFKLLGTKKPESKWKRDKGEE